MSGDKKLAEFFSVPWPQCKFHNLVIPSLPLLLDSPSFHRQVHQKVWSQETFLFMSFISFACKSDALHDSTHHGYRGARCGIEQSEEAYFASQRSRLSAQCIILLAQLMLGSQSFYLIIVDKLLLGKCTMNLRQTWIPSSELFSDMSNFMYEDPSTSVCNHDSLAGPG